MLFKIRYLKLHGIRLQMRTGCYATKLDEMLDKMRDGENPSVHPGKKYQLFK